MRLRADNPMNRTLQMVLIFEAIVFGLAYPGMVLVDDVSAARAGLVAGIGIILALVASAGLKKAWGHPLGWIVQLAGVSMGLLTSMMYAVGLFFLVIWVMSFVLGRRIEAVKPAAPTAE